MAEKTEGAAGNCALLDGASYLESLRDDREVYIYGQRVADVTSHEAFRNSARCDSTPSGGR